MRSTIFLKHNSSYTMLKNIPYILSFLLGLLNFFFIWNIKPIIERLLILINQYI